LSLGDWHFSEGPIFLKWTFLSIPSKESCHVPSWNSCQTPTVLSASVGLPGPLGSSLGTGQPEIGASSPDHQISLHSLSACPFSHWRRITSLCIYAPTRACNLITHNPLLLLLLIF
jgi:hypothetical protein